MMDILAHRIVRIGKCAQGGRFEVLISPYGEPIDKYVEHPLKDVKRWPQIWVDTKISFVDQMVSVLAKCAGWSLFVEVKGRINDDEETAFEIFDILGSAFFEALGDRTALRCFGDAHAPVEAALARACVDIGSYPQFPDDCVHFGFDFSYDPYIQFVAEQGLKIFVESAEMTLHVDVLKGDEERVCAKAAFSAVGLALRPAIELV